jgi:hypothetical protein
MQIKYSKYMYISCGRAERQAETRRENSGKKKKINRKTEQRQERKKII